MFETEGAPAGAQAPEIQEAAILLVPARKLLRIVALLQTACEICPPFEVVLIDDVFTNEGDTQRLDNCIGIDPNHELMSPGNRPIEIVRDARILREIIA